MESNLDIKEEPVWREEHFEIVTVAALPETDIKDDLDVEFKHEVTAEVFVPKVEEEEEEKEESPSSLIQDVKEEEVCSEECDISRVPVEDIHPIIVKSEVTNSPENRSVSDTRELQKSFLYSEDLQKLMSAHNQVMWCCHFCGKSFEYEPLLRNHMIDHNTEKEPSLLTESGVDSPTLVHNERRLYCCDHCGKSSFDPEDITNHMKDHEEVKPYRCKICPKAYQQQGNLQRHLQTRHGETRYSCLVCSQKFTRLDSLKRHELRHSGVRRFVCPVCNKSFIERGKFKEHKVKHRLERRRFSCLVCGKSYTQSSSLNRHKLVHLDNKNPVCGKSVGQLSRVHTRKHTDAKPYSSSIRGKKLTQSSDMESCILSHSK